MNGRQVEGSSDGRLSLSGDLSFRTVAEVWTRARSFIEASPRLTVDLTGVTRSDSAGLALLVECLRAARRGRKEIVFVNMPLQMLAVAQVSGLDRILPRSPDPDSPARGGSEYREGPPSFIDSDPVAPGASRGAR